MTGELFALRELWLFAALAPCTDCMYTVRQVVCSSSVVCWKSRSERSLMLPV